MKKGTTPSSYTLIGKFRQPVAIADANIAKIEPRMFPFLTSLKAPFIDGLLMWSSEGVRSSPCVSVLVISEVSKFCMPGSISFSFRFLSSYYFLASILNIIQKC